VLIACVADPVQMLRKNSVVPLLAYLLVPLFLIWVEGSDDNPDALPRWLGRFLGWSFLLGFGILNLVDFLMDR